jgi:hypothetical protein
MRPGQNNNKRMRGNRPSNNRRGPNPLTRSYESNGPDVKIRGNAHHIAEKYLQLARDAHTGGDPVAAENYLQHAEHYFRLIASAQAAQAQAQSGKPPGEGEGGEFEDDDDFGGVADRFASPAERAPAPYAPQPAQQGYVAPPAAGAGPQPYAEGGERPPQQQQPQGERNGGYQQGQGRQQDRQQRPQQDRGPRQDRNDRNFNDRQGRDFRPREFRPYRDANAPRDPQPAPAADAATALPSFITAAPRVTTAPDAETPGPMENGVEAGGQLDQGSSPSEQSGDGRSAGRGRRRRLRSPYGFHPSGNQDEEGEGPQAPDDAPVSE